MTDNPDNPDIVRGHRQYVDSQEFQEKTTHSEVETDGLFNKSLQDNVDYSHPAWLARTDVFYWHTAAPNLGIFENATDGSGSTSNDGRFWVVNTGTTQGSHAGLYARSERHRAHETGLDFSKSLTARASVRFRSPKLLYAVAGGITFSDKTTQHIGVRMSGGDLEATVGNGSNETTETLESNVSTPVTKQILIEYDGSRADFYIDELDTVAGSISTGLPTGTLGTIWRAQADNPDTTNDRTLDFGEVTLVNY